jgi:hypothetical protein
MRELEYLGYFERQRLEDNGRAARGFAPHEIGEEEESSGAWGENRARGLGRFSLLLLFSSCSYSFHLFIFASAWSRAVFFAAAAIIQTV